MASLDAARPANPVAGELIIGTGGASKLGWRRPSSGKNGGYRVMPDHAARVLLRVIEREPEAAARVGHGD